MRYRIRAVIRSVDRPVIPIGYSYYTVRCTYTSGLTPPDPYPVIPTSLSPY